MDNKVTESSMNEFGAFLKAYMPGVVFFTTDVGDKTIIMLVADSQLTAGILDDINRSIRIYVDNNVKDHE